jgi:hypothetical protein
MPNESNPQEFWPVQNYVAPAADSYPVTKTVLDMYTKTTRTISITAAGQETIPSGQPGGRDLFHE